MRTKIGRYGSPTVQTGILRYILHGLGVSIISTLVFSLFLSFASMATASVRVEEYMSYVVVGVTVTSIFIGSIYAAQKAGSRGLIIGVAIGAIYVFVSIALGMKVSGETITLAMFTNKFLAGVAAGALGGTVGVNL